MAEGGIAAAIGDVDDRDSWRVHFADTMRCGQYLSNWRMAELHAKEAPACVRELEAWGALFDRTGDGRILQRNFGGHRYPRLAHVGDRTGLEMIRTLQDHGIHLGLDVFMEHTIVTLLKDVDRIAGAFGYDRERGRFHLFRAKAVVLATGGIGRAYKITSNSWEYTGDGHALAYHAGSDLMDMEVVQFHPTGMIWPPSVRGILVTEGVRGEGGVLRNRNGERFMFQDIPPLYVNSTADTEEEGWRYTQGDKNAKRPPELLTRDHVARCIRHEVREGRGSPHGGVFLDIAWIKERLPNSAEYIKKKLPSMYHQFKQLADIDITEQAMEVGPTTHYIMGGVRVDPDTQMSRLPGLFAAGECAAGINGANRLGGNSLSDLLVFGKRAGEFAAKFAKENQHGSIEREKIDAVAREALAPFESAGRGSENPYVIQKNLQETMQNLVGIVRNEGEMREALEKIGKFKTRAEKAAVTGKIWRGDAKSGTFWDYTTDVAEGMVVLDAVHDIQRTQAPDLACRWNCKAGKCGSCSAEVNGMPKLMCMTRLSELPLEKPVTIEPMKAFSTLKDLVTDVSWNFSVKKTIKPFKPRPPDAADGTWRMQQEDIDRVQEFRKCIECFLCQDVCHVLRDHQMHERFLGPRFLIHVAALEMHPLDTEDRIEELRNKQGIGYWNITKCCTKVCPESIQITDNGIIPLKERVVDEFYDPLGWFWKGLKKLLNR